MTTETADTSPSAWFQEMTPPERRTFWACFAGWGLDALDAQIYSLVIPTIMVVFQLSGGEAGAIATVTLLCSAVGGWAAGLLADRIGRVRTLQLTILWFSVFTFLSGFAQSYEQLLLARALMGFGFGGEWAAGAVLIGEVIRPQYRGRAVGTVQSGWSIGWAAAVLVQTVLFSLFEPTVAWRYLFFVGVLPAFAVFLIRRFVAEPPVFEETKRRIEATGDRPGFLEIFSPAVIRTTILTSLLATGAQGGYYAVTTWLPRFLSEQRGLKLMDASGNLFVVIAGSFAGYLVGAYLADRLGRRPLFFIFSLGAIAVIYIYTSLDLGYTGMLIMGFPLGFFGSGYFSGVGAFLTELFPTRIRGSGQGFAYNFGRGVGALFPTLVGILSASMPLGQAIAVFAIGAYALLFVAALALPETKGKTLHADG
jgi:MFS family permease